MCGHRSALPAGNKNAAWCSTDTGENRQWPGNVEICSHKALMWISVLDTAWLRPWGWCEVRGSAATSWPIASPGWERRDRSPVYPSIWMKKQNDGKMNSRVVTLESRHSWSFLARESCHFIFLMMASALTGQGSITKKRQNPLAILIYTGMIRLGLYNIWQFVLDS